MYICYILSNCFKSYYSNTPVPAGDNSLEMNKIPNENCQINRYGHFKATLTIVGKAEGQWGRIPESTKLLHSLCFLSKGRGGEQGHPTLSKVMPQVHEQMLS